MHAEAADDEDEQEEDDEEDNEGEVNARAMKRRGILANLHW